MLIICPKATLAEVWLRQISTFTGFRDSTFVYHGSGREEGLAEKLKERRVARVARNHLGKVAYDDEGCCSIQYEKYNPKSMVIVLATAESLIAECKAVQNSRNQNARYKSKAGYKQVGKVSPNANANPNPNPNGSFVATLP